MSEATLAHADARAPWDDDSFDLPRETFAAFMIGNTSADPTSSDPTWVADPWIRSSGLLFRNQVWTNPSTIEQQQPPLQPWATYQAQQPLLPSPFVPAPAPMRHPIGSPVASGSPVAPQVDPEDELSDSQQEEPAVTNSPTPNAVPATRSYVGLPAGAPLHQRQGDHSISDQQIMSILHGHLCPACTYSTD